MKILMTGLDYKSAELAVREKFAVTKERSKNIISAYMDLPFVKGCAIISTCNRTEIYISTQDCRQFNIAEFLCGILELDAGKYIPYFTQRNEKETFSHLCRVAAGIDSQILGDDQIITQVRESLESSRANNFADSYIEKIFGTAIKAAKEIKTNIIVRSAHVASAPYKAVEKIKSIIPIAGQKAVVIGNGQMGRLTAELLLNERAHVTVTLREYKKGVVLVPDEAETIGYSKKYDVIETAQIVVSATTSPHYTLRYEDFIKLNNMPEIIVDLAVPRDIEPSIGELPGVSLFTIDDLGDENSSLPDDKMVLAEQIIEKNVQNYYKWRKNKEKIK